MIIYERASLVPAAAVIPALVLHFLIVVVKKLVVGSTVWLSYLSFSVKRICVVCSTPVQYFVEFILHNTLIL
jgi:hypothetical protein